MRQEKKETSEKKDHREKKRQVRANFKRNGEREKTNLPVEEKAKGRNTTSLKHGTGGRRRPPESQKTQHLSGEIEALSGADPQDRTGYTGHANDISKFSEERCAVHANRNLPVWNEAAKKRGYFGLARIQPSLRHVVSERNRALTQPSAVQTTQDGHTEDSEKGMTYCRNLAALSTPTSIWQPYNTIQTNWLLDPGGSLIRGQTLPAWVVTHAGTSVSSLLLHPLPHSD
ncbi:hypothetical protein IRJ41_012482 [Triplophysa rosa]|uniref:Uncharacterized protein n=1 Tax=Triplophysa rosa TaxID=992332 RepID=A0A9W8C4I7_TRIRA|nr:hypothetical protein IRJ41_012482 [Triplophysa rosa]